MSQKTADKLTETFVTSAIKNDHINACTSSIDNSQKNALNIKIGGIEGGSTHSSLIIMNGEGHQLAHVKGPGTNHWALGMMEAASRINSMIKQAKMTIGMAENQPLDCVGLCLSGCEEKETNNQLYETLLNEFPNASKDYVVGSDTYGSLKTGSDTWGIVLIAGTGSNALLVNDDGSSNGCGGWGHMMGDEGGAFWIAREACKYVFDDMDGLKNSLYSTTFVWDAMKKFFNVTNRNEMLPHLYTNFDKSKFALFTKELANGCEQNDELCKFLFTKAGKYLAKHVNALISKAHNENLTSRGLKVICVGSVWKSWEFMKCGFTDDIENEKLVNDLTLLRLKVPAATGACYIASDKIKCVSLMKSHDKNSEAFFHYQRGVHSQNNGMSVSAIDNCFETNKESESH